MTLGCRDSNPEGFWSVDVAWFSLVTTGAT
jgi:hypothetical protein